MLSSDSKAFHGVKVLSRNEYERIISSLNARESAKAERDSRNKEKQRLKELSAKQVGKWSNTLHGQRKAKLEAKKNREEKEEEIRKQEDIAEAIYQAEQRRKAIEHAKTLTFARTDMVKDFHGALILTEVLKEREAQIELNKKRQEAALMREEKRIEKFKQQLNEMAEVEERNKRERIRKTKDVQKHHLEQIEAKRENAAKELEEWKKEGAEIQQLTKEHEALENEKLVNLEKKKAEVFQWYHDYLRETEEIKKKEKARGIDEQAEIKIFNNHKRHLARLQKERARAKREQKQKTATKLLAHLERTIAEQNDEIEQQAQKIKEEIENNENYIMAQREEKRKHELNQTVAHRARAVEEHVMARERLLEQERIEVREKMEGDREWKRQLREKEKKRRSINTEFQNSHLERINNKAAKERHERELNLACDKTITHLNLMEEAEFQDYAKDVIDEAKAKGRNSYPLQKAAVTGVGGGRGPKFSGIGGLRPSLMACDQTGVQMPNYAQRASTKETKKKWVSCARIGKKRLGFVW